MLELQQIYESLSDPKQIEIVAALLPILQNYEDRLAKLEKGNEEIVVDWTKEWLELFPKIKTGSGKPLRSNLIDCEIKMKNFIKKYKYSKNTIFEATKNYLNEQDENYTYTRCATYFIDKKGEGSTLADFCANLNTKEKRGNFLIPNDFI